MHAMNADASAKLAAQNETNAPAGVTPTDVADDGAVK